MRNQVWPRAGIALALSLALLPIALLPADDKPETVKSQVYSGKVVPLAEVLAKSDAKLDADAAPYWLALVTEEGKVYPIVKDAGSRMFFKDPRLLNRPMRLTARPAGKSDMLQVVRVYSVRQGQVSEVFYWCVICAIKRFEQNDCECCGAPMELREEPVPR